MSNETEIKMTTESQVEEYMNSIKDKETKKKSKMVAMIVIFRYVFLALSIGAVLLYLKFGIVWVRAYIGIVILLYIASVLVAMLIGLIDIAK